MYMPTHRHQPTTYQPSHLPTSSHTSAPPSCYVSQTFHLATCSATYHISSHFFACTLALHIALSHDIACVSWLCEDPFAAHARAPLPRARRTSALVAHASAPTLGMTSYSYYVPQAAQPAVGGVETAVGSGDTAVGGGEPVVGGVPAHPWQPATLHRYIPPWQPGWAMDDIACYRQKPEWRSLIDWLKSNIVIKPRKLLANHTTTACMPKKASGPSSHSLSDGGMDRKTVDLGENTTS